MPGWDDLSPAPPKPEKAAPRAPGYAEAFNRGLRESAPPTSDAWEKLSPAAPATAPAPAPTAPSRSIWDRIIGDDPARDLSRGTGNVVDGAGAAVGFLANPLNTVLNAVLPGAPLATDVGTGWGEALGFEQPRNQRERLERDITVGATAGLATAAGAAPMAARAAPGLATSFLQFLADAPVVNTVAGGTGGGSAGVAREMGYGPVGQTVAGLAGGLAGGVAAARIGRPRAPGMPPDDLVDGALDGGGLPIDPRAPSPGWRRSNEDIVDAEFYDVVDPALPAPAVRLPAPPAAVANAPLALPAPLRALADLRGEPGAAANSNRVAPIGRTGALDTPEVIAPAPYRPEAAPLIPGDGAAPAATTLPGRLLASTSDQRGPADVWARLAARRDAANDLDLDLDLPAIPDRPLRYDLPDVAPPAAGIGSRARMVAITESTESGGRRFGSNGKLLTSPKGARGEMQVMPGTERDPGYGVTPARNGSPDELARVGRDYLAALTRHYGGDPAKGWAAYNAGPGRLDRAIKLAGEGWLSRMPAETRAYVDKNMVALGDDGPISSTAPAAPRTADLRGSQTDFLPSAERLGTALAERPTGLDPLPPIDPPAAVASDTVASAPPPVVGAVPVAREPDAAAGSIPAATDAIIPAPVETPAIAPPPAAPAARAPRPQSIRPEKPVDVLTFLARNGGLRDTEGHALRMRSRSKGAGSRDLPQFAPGGGHVFRKTGKSIDQAGELLHEAGYFTERPTTAQVLEMLDRAGSDRQYRPADMPAVMEARASARDIADRDYARSQVDDAVAEWGFDDLDDGVRTAIAERMSDGIDAHRALEDHFRERSEARSRDFYEATNDPDYDVPFYEGDAPRSPDIGDVEGFERSPAERARSGGSPPDGGPAPTDRGGTDLVPAPVRGGEQRALVAPDAAPAPMSRIDRLQAVHDGAIDGIPSSQLDELIRDGVVVIDKNSEFRLTPRGRKELLQAGRDVGDGESGFIRMGSAADWAAVRNDAAALAAKVTQVFGAPKAALRSTVARVGQFGEATLYSADASLRSMAARLNAPTIEKVADLFHSRAGAPDSTGRTYHEAVNRATHTRTQTLYDTLEPFLKDKAAMGRIRDLLATPTANLRATAKERAAAVKVRDLLKDTLEYRRDAGESIGEVADGYFPRVVDAMKVARNPAAFIRAAERLYRQVGASDPHQSATAWAQRITDTYAGIDGGLENIRGGTAPASGKTREFGKLADTALRDFYNTDPFDALASYIAGSARKAEQARRFGPQGREGSPERLAWIKQHGRDRSQWAVMMDQIKDELRASGGDVDGVPDAVLAIRNNNLGTQYQSAGNAVSLLHTWNTIGVMDRATITSLGDLAMGFVRGGPRYGFEHLATSLHEFGRRLVGRPDSDATRYAEAVGVANDAFGAALLQARADGGTKLAIGSKLGDGFYRAIGLQQLTDAGRVAATKTGQRFLGDLASDMVSTDARTRSRGASYLRELGVTDPDAFAADLRKGAPTRDDLLGDADGFHADYATALMRYVEQSILMPTKAQRPGWTNHPTGSLFFALQSYSYGFKKNVLDRVGRETASAVREGDPQRLAAASGLAILAGLTYVNDTYVRPALFGKRHEIKDESTVGAAIRVADRAGALGPLSPIFNAFSAVRYRRSPVASLAGPIVGRLGDGATAAVKVGFFDSANTNTDERAAAAAVYDLAVEPALDTAAVRYLRGPARTLAVEATGNRNGDGVLPGDREAFTSALAGPKAE